jgi:hypothetical protein
MKIPDFKNILSLIRNAPTYLDWYWKWERMKSDFDVMRTEWHHMGGFSASTGRLLNFASDYSLLCVEYAAWTPTPHDDTIVKAVRYVITDHRDIMINLIDWVRHGHEPETHELKALAEIVSVSTVDAEYASPMMILYIIAALYQILRFLKSLKQETIPEPPKVEPQPVRRPLINAIRNFLDGIGVGRRQPATCFLLSSPFPS